MFVGIPDNYSNSCQQTEILRVDEKAGKLRQQHFRENTCAPIKFRFDFGFPPPPFTLRKIKERKDKKNQEIRLWINPQNPFQRRMFWVYNKFSDFRKKRSENGSHCYDEFTCDVNPDVSIAYLQLLNCLRHQAMRSIDYALQ